jgi:hypothetical protein
VEQKIAFLPGPILFMNSDPYFAVIRAKGQRAKNLFIAKALTIYFEGLSQHHSNFDELEEKS